MIRLRFLFIPLLAAMLLGCEGGAVRSSIESYSLLEQAGQGRTITILPTDKEIVGALEFKTNASKLAQRLTLEGYSVVDGTGIKPQYVAFFAYGVDDGKLVQSTYSIPRWGVTGYSGATTSGTVNVYGNSATYNARTILNPQYGVTGYDTGIRTDQLFTRALILDIYDTSKIDFNSKSIVDAQVYTAKLRSTGSCGNIAGVLDALLDALFKDFPGTNSAARTVEVPYKPATC